MDRHQLLRKKRHAKNAERNAKVQKVLAIIWELNRLDRARQGQIEQ